MLKRGRVVIIVGGGSSGNKPRPALVVQDDSIALTDTVILVPFTTTLVDAPLSRPRFVPDPKNGLRQLSALMTDKIAASPRANIGAEIGELSEDDMERADAALAVMLGLTR